MSKEKEKSEAKSEEKSEKDLFRAIREGNIEETRKLLQIFGDSINSCFEENKQTVLHAAASVDNVSIMKLLVEHHARIDVYEESTFRTPLHYMAELGNIEGVQLLIENKADLNSQFNEYTSLGLAAFNGRFEIVKALCNAGADISVKCKDGLTAKEWSEKNGHKDITDYLKKQRKKKVFGKLSGRLGTLFNSSSSTSSSSSSTLTSVSSSSNLTDTPGVLVTPSKLAQKKKRLGSFFRSSNSSSTPTTITEQLGTSSKDSSPNHSPSTSRPPTPPPPSHSRPPPPPAHAFSRQSSLPLSPSSLSSPSSASTLITGSSSSATTSLSSSSRALPPVSPTLSPPLASSSSSSSSSLVSSSVPPPFIPPPKINLPQTPTSSAIVATPTPPQQDKKQPPQPQTPQQQQPQKQPPSQKQEEEPQSPPRSKSFFFNGKPTNNSSSPKTPRFSKKLSLNSSPGKNSRKSLSKKDSQTAASSPKDSIAVHNFNELTLNYPPAPSNFISEDGTLFHAISKFEDQRREISKLIQRGRTLEHKTVPSFPASLAIFDVDEALHAAKENLKSILVACEKVAECDEKQEKELNKLCNNRDNVIKKCKSYLLDQLKTCKKYKKEWETYLNFLPKRLPKLKTISSYIDDAPADKKKPENRDYDAEIAEITNGIQNNCDSLGQVFSDWSDIVKDEYHVKASLWELAFKKQGNYNEEDDGVQAIVKKAKLVRDVEKKHQEMTLQLMHRIAEEQGNLQWKYDELAQLVEEKEGDVYSDVDDRRKETHKLLNKLNQLSHLSQTYLTRFSLYEEIVKTKKRSFANMTEAQTKALDTQLETSKIELELAYAGQKLKVSSSNAEKTLTSKVTDLQTSIETANKKYRLMRKKMRTSSEELMKAVHLGWFPEVSNRLQSSENAATDRTLQDYADLKLLDLHGDQFVYRATIDDSPVYLQKFKLEEKSTEGFRRAIRAVSALDHPNVMKVATTFVQESSLYMEIPFIGNGSLLDLINQKAKLSLDDRYFILFRLFQAVEYLHSRSIVHRDLRPENIFQSDIGTPVVCWFDIQSLANEHDGENSSTSSGTSNGSSLFGGSSRHNSRTSGPCYQPPEALGLLGDDFEIDPQHRKKYDSWTLGCLVYQLFTDNKHELDSSSKRRRSYITSEFPYEQVTKQKSSHWKGFDICKNGKVNQVLDHLLHIDPRKRASVGDALNLHFFRVPPYFDDSFAQDDDGCGVFTFGRHVLHLLGIHPAYLAPKYDKCYCEVCMTERVAKSDDQDGKRWRVSGPDSKRYTLPIGAARFGVKMAPNLEKIDGSLDLWNEWNRSYLGTGSGNFTLTKQTIASLLLGYLPRATEVDDLDISGRDNSKKIMGGIRTDNKKNSASSSSQSLLISSPSFKYASLHLFSKPFPVPASGDTFSGGKPGTRKAQIVFQLLQKPGFTLGNESVGGFEDPDLFPESNKSSHDVEWMDRRRESYLVTGLLIKPVDD